MPSARSEYQSAERTGTRRAWEDFLAKYPSGRYSDLARDRLAKLDPPGKEPITTPTRGTSTSPPSASAQEGLGRTSSTGIPRAAMRTSLATSLRVSNKPDIRVDDPAIQNLDKAIQLNPNDAAAYYKRGILFAQRGDFQRAIEDFDQTLRLNPKDAESLNNRCWLRAIVGELQSALRDCDEALQIRPRYADALGQPRLCQPQIGPAQQGNRRLRLSRYGSIPSAHRLCMGAGSPSLRIGNTAAGNNDIAAAKAIQPNIADEFAGYGIR